MICSDVSGEKITKITERKEQRKDTEVAFQMTAQFGKEEDCLRHVDGATEYASEKLWGEYDQVAQIFVYRKSEFEFYTKRDYTKNHLDIEDDLQMHIEKTHLHQSKVSLKSYPRLLVRC